MIGPFALIGFYKIRSSVIWANKHSISPLPTFHSDSFLHFLFVSREEKNITHRKIQQTHFREGKKNQWLSGKISTWKPPSSDWVCRELRRTINLLRSTEPIPTKELCRPTTRTHRNPAGKLTPIPPNATKKIPLPPSKHFINTNIFNFLKKLFELLI